MKRIAVFIHGELRFWDVSSKIFSLWNKQSDEYKFDFYLATWKTEKVTNVEKYLKLENYSVHTQEEMYREMASPLRYYFTNIEEARGIPSYQHFYSYLVTKSVEALCKSTNKNRKYDAAITIRPDVFANVDVFKFFESKFNFTKKAEFNNTVPFGDSVIYSQSGTTYCQDSLFCGNDTMFIGSLNGIKTFGDIYNDIFRKQVFPPYHLHKLQAEYIHWKGMYNSKAVELFPKLIRPQDNVKPGWPTQKALEVILEKYGDNVYSRENVQDVNSILLEYSK